MEKEIQQKESIKLSKMSKGYNWEIRLLSTKDILDLKDLERMELYNKDCERRYGNKDENNRKD